MNDEENERTDRIESYPQAKINFAHLAATSRSAPVLILNTAIAITTTSRAFSGEPGR